MKIVILDAKTLGGDVDFAPIERLGDVTIHQTTSQLQLEDRIKDAEIIVVNKIKLGRDNLGAAKRLKLICVTATGYDNIDVDYCWSKNIGVCNIKGYSTDSVAQVTVSMALSLVTHIGEFNNYVKIGRYTESGVQNRLKPYFHEIKSLTWGIIGGGNIGGEVARLARAFGCRVIIKPHEMRDGYGFVTMEELLEQSDIISLHVPLTRETRGMIDSEAIGKMKDGVVLINVSRGAVCDEKALADGVLDGKIGGLGIDVYSVEPLQSDSPLNRIMNKNNVLLTPHMAWGAYEARVRCIDEIAKNIDTFIMGGTRNRVDLN